MGELASLANYLDRWVRGDAKRAPVAATVGAVASAAAAIAKQVARGGLSGAAEDGAPARPDSPYRIDLLADELLQQALGEAPVAVLASEARDEVLKLERHAPLAVAVHPLDRVTHLESNVPAGTLFSIYPVPDAGAAATAFQQPGAEQLAAGFVAYGPHTALVVTMGEGVFIFTLDQDRSEFYLTHTGVQIPTGTREYAIDASGQRYWDESICHYIDERNGRKDRPGYSMRWTASLVAEAYRILIRGGVFLAPRQSRPGYESGRTQLLFAANPIALLVEQAKGAASDGTRRVLDIVPQELHQRIPFFFGASDQVEQIARNYGDPDSLRSRSPLFRSRDLFRS